MKVTDVPILLLEKEEYLSKLDLRISKCKFDLDIVRILAPDYNDRLHTIDFCEKYNLTPTDTLLKLLKSFYKHRIDHHYDNLNITIVSKIINAKIKLMGDSRTELILKLLSKYWLIENSYTLKDLIDGDNVMCQNLFGLVNYCEDSLHRRKLKFNNLNYLRNKIESDIRQLMQCRSELISKDGAVIVQNSTSLIRSQSLIKGN